MTGFAISFRVNKKIPDSLTVCDNIISTYEPKIVGYAVGEDSTYMEGEEPHYHVHLVTGEFNDDGKKITLSAIEKVRQRRWKFGQDCKMKVSEWDGDISFLAYAIKEKEIRVNLPLGVDLAEFQLKVKETLNNKIHRHEEFKKQQKLINAKKDLKTHLLKYIDANMDEVKRKVHVYQSHAQYSSDYVPHTGHLEEPALVKICLEKYQKEEKKHFRQFEIDRFVCDYFRTKKDYLEMYFLRNGGPKTF